MKALAQIARANSTVALVPYFGSLLIPRSSSSTRTLPRSGVALIECFSTGRRRKTKGEGGRANPDKLLDDVWGIRYQLKDNPADPNEENGSIPRLARTHAERIKDS